MKTKQEILKEVAEKYDWVFDEARVGASEVADVIYEAMERYKDEWWEEQTKKLEE